MKAAASAERSEKTIVLVGAGNAHLQFVKCWGKRPIRGVAVTLVNDAPVVPYSAMVPAHIAGEYTWDEITIDLVRLCQAVKVRFVPETVVGLDPVNRQVCFVSRPTQGYDVLSLGLGSLPACPAGPKAFAFSLALRPLAALLRQLEALEASLGRSPRPFHLAIIGGGASGCELVLAIHERLGYHDGFRMTLLQGEPRLLPQFPARAARFLMQAFQAREIDLQLNARVTSGDAGVLHLDNGARVTCDGVLWATDATPPPLLRESGLAVDERGFLLVRNTLQSLGDPAVFGTGDCVHFPSYPDLPKNGVYAVKQGAVLFDNLVTFLREQPLRPFRPQWFYLSLLNTADHRAILTYGPFARKGRWARRLKDRIDRAWIDKFTR